MLINQRVEPSADYCKKYCALLEFTALVRHTTKQVLIDY